jgi:hypothetical protein
MQVAKTATIKDPDTDYPFIKHGCSGSLFTVQSSFVEAAKAISRITKGLRRNKFTFWRERRMGRCKAPRRRRCGTSSRSGNAADARPPPRPEGLPVLRFVDRVSAGIANCKPENRQQNVKLFLRSP